MTTPFAAKLRLTAAAQGCATRKELCERFRAVNPATAFDVERCHKWLQGVAMPCSATVYDDWVKVIGFDRSAAWIAASTQDAFAEALCAHLSADRADLEVRAARFGGPRAAGAAPAAGLGTFAVYSWAMSPRHEGKLIRGGLTLGAARGRRIAAEYEEGLVGGPLRFAGSATEAGRTLSVALDSEGNPGGGRFFMVPLTPGRPLDAMCGEFLGAPINAALAEPTVSRAVALRIDPAFGPAAVAPDCYLATDPTALAADLGLLGFGEIAPRLPAVLLDVLSGVGPAVRRTGTAELALLTAALEPPVLLAVSAPAP
ncbi:hypothetical protein [Rubrimonas sp.]|uniref:hypothetical protein n=1 Tax=Rubrimonas sp. TaxID=2036015 RepID=UPI002FDEEA6E